MTSSFPSAYCNTFTFMHLADAFIQSDLQCIQVMHCFCQYMCSLGIEPTTFCAANTMLYHWATGTLLFISILGLRPMSCPYGPVLMVFSCCFRAGVSSCHRTAVTCSGSLRTPPVNCTRDRCSRVRGCSPASDAGFPACSACAASRPTSRSVPCVV